MARLPSFWGQAVLFLSALAAAQSSSALDGGDVEPVSSEFISTGRYIVKFSTAGSLKFRKRDGSLVSSVSLFGFPSLLVLLICCYCFLFPLSRPLLLGTLLSISSFDRKTSN